MKKKSKIYKNYMNRKIIQIYTVETLQLFTLCLWTMLQHVKVGHIALSQMIIFIFGLKRGHLIYLGPTTGVHVPGTATQQTTTPTDTFVAAFFPAFFFFLLGISNILSGTLRFFVGSIE